MRLGKRMQGVKSWRTSGKAAHASDSRYSAGQFFEIGERLPIHTITPR
jgi:hypothetical protein